jgi:hypothetical protein
VNKWISIVKKSPKKGRMVWFYTFDHELDVGFYEDVPYVPFEYYSTKSTSFISILHNLMFWREIDRQKGKHIFHHLPLYHLVTKYKIPDSPGAELFKLLTYNKGVKLNIRRNKK